jgi:hypothetical protein
VAAGCAVGPPDKFKVLECDLLLLLLLLLQAVLALHPGWRATTIWEFPRIHMAHTPQVCRWRCCHMLAAP